MAIEESLKHLQPGDMIDRYEVVESPIEGAFVFVVICYDTELRRQVALRFDRFSQENVNYDAFREANRILAGLQHSCLLAIHDVGVAFDIPYVVCEYAPGTLSKHIKSADASRFPWIREAFESISQAVDLVHRRGFVHRNINPKTILLDVNGNPKLAGFELAVKNEHIPDGVAGTPLYMAPEQISGKNERISPATDVWGIGATLYHTLTGQPPFESVAMIDLAIRILQEEPRNPQAINPHIPSDLQDICLRCLQKDASNRFDSAEQVARALSNLPGPSGSNGKRVFVSHSSKDREFVERQLISELESHGIETWYSKASIQTAAEWEKSILYGLESCDWFLIVMTSRSAESEWVKDELFWAIENRQGRVIPVMAEDCDPRNFHIRLARIEFVDFRDDPAAGITSLLATMTQTN